VPNLIGGPEVPNLKFGALGIPSLPVAQDAQAAKGYETAGVDFFAHWDQRNLITPCSIRTPDVVPAGLRERNTTSVPA